MDLKDGMILLQWTIILLLLLQQNIKENPRSSGLRIVVLSGAIVVTLITAVVVYIKVY